MIVKVWGHANGIEIIFTRKEGSIWTAELPSNLDGKYVVDLWAESDTGKRAYMCKILFAIHGHKLQVEILNRGFCGELSLGGFLAKLEKGEFLTEAEKGEYTVENKIC